MSLRGSDGYWHGAPDLIIEILSPGTTRQDRDTKYRLYEANGVREYWIVEAEELYIEVYHLHEGKYKRQGIFGLGETFEFGCPEWTHASGRCPAKRLTLRAAIRYNKIENARPAPLPESSRQQRVIHAMFALITFFIGLFILFKGSFRLGSRSVTQAQARSIGFYLMAPLGILFCASTLLVYNYIQFSPDGTFTIGADAFNYVSNTIGIIELIAVGIAVLLVAFTIYGTPIRDGAPAQNIIAGTQRSPAAAPPPPAAPPPTS